MVRLQQAAQELFAIHFANAAAGGFNARLLRAKINRHSVAEALVRAVLVEEPLIRPNSVAQAVQAEHDQVIQAFLPRAAGLRTPRSPS